MNGNAYIYDFEIEACTYSFDGATLKRLEVDEANDEGGVDVTLKGFTLEYESKEACETDPASKFYVNIIGRCNNETTSADALAVLDAGFAAA